MRVAPWDAPGDEASPAEPEAGGRRLNAMRSWLVSGVHVFVVDPRRRFGRHGRTRELLVLERPAQHEASERWQTLAAALHRHTVRDGLARLSAAERRIITLAYLEGHTNREIAAMLSVSVSTVRRRLLVALEHLDTFLRRSGAWLAAFALAALAYLNGYAARGARWAGSPAAGDRAHLVAATLAVGALGVAAVGFVSLSRPTAPSVHLHTAIAAPIVHVKVGVSALPSGPHIVAAAVLPNTTAGARTVTRTASSVAPTGGCHGNPTSAPPQTPVGPPSHHPTGPPVRHPGPGGCRAL
jgi:hypothetical protein